MGSGVPARFRIEVAGPVASSRFKARPPRRTLWQWLRRYPGPAALPPPAVPDTADYGTRPSGPLIVAPRHLFRWRTTAQVVTAAAPHSTPWLPKDYVQNFRRLLRAQRKAFGRTLASQLTSLAGTSRHM
jgi:hypothetical protein